MTPTFQPTSAAKPLLSCFHWYLRITMANKHPRTEQDIDWTPRRKMTHTFKEQHLLVSLEPPQPSGKAVPLPASQAYSQRSESGKHGRRPGGKNRPETITEFKRLQGKLDRMKRAKSLYPNDEDKWPKKGWTDEDSAEYARLKAIHQESDGRRRARAPRLVEKEKDMKARAATVKAMLDPTVPLMYPVPAPGSFPTPNYFTQVSAAQFLNAPKPAARPAQAPVAPLSPLMTMENMHQLLPFLREEEDYKVAHVALSALGVLLQKNAEAAAAAAAVAAKAATPVATMVPQVHVPSTPDLFAPTQAPASHEELCREFADRIDRNDPGYEWLTNARSDDEDEDEDDYEDGAEEDGDEA